MTSVFLDEYNEMSFKSEARLFFARQPDIYLFTACLDLSAHTQGEMCLSFLAALKFPGGLQERKTQDQGRAYIAA